MGRKPLSEEERNKRAAEKEAQMATKRTYNKQTPIMETNTTPDNNTPVNENNNTVNETTPQTETTNPVVETPVQTTSVQETAQEIKVKPFAGKMKERSYSTVKIDTSLLNRDIPEVGGMTDSGASNQPNASEILNKPINNNEGANPTATVVAEQTGFNKLSPSEQDQASKMAADLFLGAYEKGHVLAQQVCTVSDRRLNKMKLNNEIDLDIEIAPETKTENAMTLGGFVNQINTNIKSELVVTEEFKSEVREPLQRLAKKMGIGVSDEWYVIGKFGMDIAQKGAIVVGLRNTINDMLSHYSKQYKDAYAAHVEAQRQIHEANERVLAAEKRAAELEAKANEKASTKPLEETVTPAA